MRDAISTMEYLYSRTIRRIGGRNFWSLPGTERVITAAKEVDNDYRKYSENSQTDIENIRTSNTINTLYYDLFSINMFHV